MQSGIKACYDDIADGWNNLRQRPMFNELYAMAGIWKKRAHNDVVLDIGCGNGRNMLPFKDFKIIGLDISRAMIKHAKKFCKKHGMNAGFVVADATHIPFKCNSIGFAIAIAVYHHIKDAGSRLMAFSELRRVLKHGSRAFISVWNRFQPRFLFLRHDIYVPWRSKERVYFRYYHLFSTGELKKDLKAAGFDLIRVMRCGSSFFRRNVCVMVAK